mmetsp:Transcript_29133/g.45274  ORF Transcript_29133/g.45274 Transcript_29133/m.45274 type:complete len:222 (+) Transcript_29133:82-747(+)|eukprot:CAMPEP_0196813184 /NCGR_PEP_ID=MMETSP1362-20130617/34489_1 /TAXON_ID=163516 /ORGANISM="Leptocylindrus danicus, Strain CCMP1856" /LENGTH=221 /DNA_ID=CAMNT_0042189261 /DNA_START=58 /DNA_END=723 /DNA_ORIENTATION=+
MKTTTSTALLLLSSLLVPCAAFAPSSFVSKAVGSTTRLFAEEAAVETAEATEEEVAASEWKGAKAISGLTADVGKVFQLEDIAKILPHRYPFALVDKIVEYEPGQRAVGVKCVTNNEPHFTGHFPDRPIMPGVMQVEALAQLAGTIFLQMPGVEPGAIFFFAGVDGVKWKKPVVPGDTLVMEVEVLKWRAKFGIAKAVGRAYVDGELAVELSEMTFAIAKD